MATRSESPPRRTGPRAPRSRGGDRAAESNDALSIREARELLRRRRAQLVTRRDEHRHDRGDIWKDRPLDAGDAAADEESQSLLDQLTEGEFLQLKAIDAALARIDAGEYGNCVRCGQEIDPGRLRAIPETALCIECADQLASSRR